MTPPPTQGQAYQIHVGDTVVMELAQVPIFCTVLPVESARWESTNPGVAAIRSYAGPTFFAGSQFPAQLIALSPGNTTVRAVFLRRGREQEADQAQLVFVLP
jgi:hypothetical protein